MRWAAALSSIAVIAGCGARTGLEGSDSNGDGVPAGPDAQASRIPPGCDADVPSVFLLTDTDRLLSFDPPSVATQLIGRLDCPTPSTPNSMTAARNGDAYVNYGSGQLFRVSTTDAGCERTSFDVGQLVFSRYGMGFVADRGTGEETLYVAQNNFTAPSPGLQVIDTSTFALRFVAPFQPPLLRVELTGTGDGRLFGFAMDIEGSRLVTIDRATGEVQTVRAFDFGGNDTSFDFAFWGGEFFLFVAKSDQPSTVWKYTPADDSVLAVGSLDDTIVGAGVTTCAPLR